MITALPVYDELYAVSDIHMGGPPGFQILNQGPRLGRFIEHLARVRPEDEVALVLNGDIIDSLAEDIDGYIAYRDTEKMLRRIARDPAFEPVWSGLAKFVRQPKRHLVLVLGNHDIELALPHVEFWIRRLLSDGDAAALGRMTFSTRGAGHACRVAGARVLCTHGNEVDDWNVVDYEALGDLAAALSSERTYPRSEWRPNAGTQLVIDVMNDIKRDYPFVDLLKPETKAVVPILLSLDPGRVKDALRALPRVAGRFAWGALERRGYLSVDELEDGMDTRAGDVVLENLLGPHLQEGLQISTAREDDAEAMLRSVERSVAAGHKPEEAPELETLGTFGYIYDRIRGVDPVEALRRALMDWLENDVTFALDTRDATFEQVSKRVGPEVHFIVTGHTHLERAIPLVGQSRFYYNCGTWIRLLRFTEKLLGDPTEFERVYGVLQNGTMADLDKEKVMGKDPLVLLRSTAVRIGKEPDGVVGELLHVVDGAKGKVKLEKVRDSRFARS